MKPEKNLIIACTGSVATIKLLLLIQELRKPEIPFKFNIKVVTTKHAKSFFNTREIPDDIQVLDDDDEWSAWNERGDPVVHIELGKWADILVIAPLSANSLAKISTGICDNLVLCIIRAWNMSKPLLFCPAMNTRMYDHPITGTQICTLKSWGYHEVPCIAKTLMCGDTGNGAMATVQTIIEFILARLMLTTSNVLDIVCG